MFYKCFINNPDSSNENAYKSYKTNLPILFESLNVYVMKNNKLKCKCYGFWIEIKVSVAHHQYLEKNSHEISDPKEIANFYL